MWSITTFLAAVSPGGTPPRAVAHSSGIVREIPRAPRCDSLPPTSDTMSYQVYATLEVPTEYRLGDDGKLQRDSVSTTFRRMVLQTIRQNFVPPQNPSLTTFVVRREVRPPVAAPVVFGEAMFSLTPTGGLADAELAQSSLSPEINQSLIDALHRADAAHMFPLPSEAGAKLSKVYVHLASGPLAPDSAALLFTIHVPAWQQWTYPGLDPAHRNAVPAYPTELEHAGYEGSLGIEFVVNADGSVEPSTVRLAWSTFNAPPSGTLGRAGVHLADFITAIMTSLNSARFLPGTVGGCAVRELSAQPYNFKMRR